MNKSKIEWTDRSWNPVSGCSHVSEGCRNCYAERFFPRVYGGKFVPMNKSRSEFRTRRFIDVQCHPERLGQPLKIKKPQRIFVNSMSDLFHEDVPDEFIEKIFNVMFEARQHTFQILTKRPHRMRDFFLGTSGCGASQEPMPNVWLGVSVEDQKTADERIPLLLETPAAVRWISAEPLLGPIDLLGMDCFPQFDYRQTYAFHRCASGNPDPSPIKIKDGLDWIVVGGESGPKSRPMEIEWAWSMAEDCRLAGVPFFFKQGSQNNWINFKDFNSFPSDLQTREFPNVT